MSRGAALLGGTFYAVWFGAAGTEISSRLEPLSSFFFLCGLWFLTGDRASTRRNLLLGGAAVGAAATVKIWWVVPLIVVLAWQLRSASARRGVGWLAGGALGAMAIVCAPFFIAAPGAMWRMVVTDQLGRHTSTPPRVRLNDLASLHAAFPGLHGVGEVAVLAIIAAAVIGLGLAAWRVRAARLVVTIAAVQLVVLMSAPTYFAYYSGYLGVAFSLVVAAAAASRRELRTRRSRALGPVGARAVVVTAAALTAISLFRPNVLSVPFPGNQLAGKVSHVRCLMADSPMALIGLNALSRDLANGCPNWVDVSGRTYDVDSPSGKFVSRVRNAKWQRDIRAYLLSGNALILIRPATGLSPATRAAVSRGTVLARSGGYVVYEYRPG
jgi:hypothetical protein